METFADCPQCFDNTSLPQGHSSLSPWLRGGRPASALSRLARAACRGGGTGEERRVFDFFLPEKAKSVEDGKESTAAPGQRHR